MSWFSLALISTLVSTLVIHLDKFLVSFEVREFHGLPIYGSIVNLVFSILFWVYSGCAFLPPQPALLLLIAGASSIWGGYIYYIAISEEQSSFIITLVQMTSILVLVLSFIFLHDPISAKQLLGFFLVLIPALALSLQQSDSISRVFHFKHSFWLVLVADLVWASGTIILKYVSQEIPFFQLASYDSLGLAVGGLFMYLLVPRVRQDFSTTFHQRGWRVLKFVIIGETMYVFAKLIQIVAIMRGPVALVSVVGNAQVFFGIIVGAVLTRWMPAVFQEDISLKSLVNKFVWAAVMFVGIILVT